MRDEGGDFESWVGGFQKLLECDKGEWDFKSCWSGIMLYWRAGKLDHTFKVFRQMGKHGKVRYYYKKQKRLLEGFNKMKTINESGYLPDMLLNKAHNIVEMLQEKLEKLSKVERAFVHIEFEFSH
nr:metal tolerance protein 9-like [Tanacetum cinerariifolium]